MWTPELERSPMYKFSIVPMSGILFAETPGS